MTRGSPPSPVRDAATKIVKRLADEGFTAYFAGGCVRDELLGLHPQDYDVATDATPDDVRKCFRHTNEVGAVFGVMLVRTGGLTIEVATFREESDYSDRRRPDSVHFTNAEHDAQRRDFTINALFLDPLDDSDVEGGVSGRIHDFVGGVSDLRAGIVRAVGKPSDRLAEDHLRGLRGVRFAARLGFELEPATAQAIREDAKELTGVSRERIGHEMRRMLGHPSRKRAAQLLDALSLSDKVLGAAAGPHAKPDLPTLAEIPDKALFITALLAWELDRHPERLSDVDSLTLRLREALCLTNEERDLFRNSLRCIPRLEELWGEMGVAERKRLASSRWFEPTFDIVTARSPECAAQINGDIASLAATPSGLAPTPLINGDDLEAEGFAPGPEFSIWLTQVYDAQLEDRVRTREEALAFVKAIAEAR